MLKEFKSFISRGNVLDLAIGVIIGAAFGKIVSSLVDDLLMPLIGVIIGGIDFKGLNLKIGESTIYYGRLIQNIIDFLIVAICVFIIVKLVNKLINNKKKDEVPCKKEEVLLLEEIRDLLKK